jgi:hypothetical protein
MSLAGSARLGQCTVKRLRDAWRPRSAWSGFANYDECRGQEETHPFLRNNLLRAVHHARVRRRLAWDYLHRLDPHLDGVQGMTNQHLHREGVRRSGGALSCQRPITTTTGARMHNVAGVAPLASVHPPSGEAETGPSGLPPHAARRAARRLPLHAAPTAESRHRGVARSSWRTRQMPPTPPHRKDLSGPGCFAPPSAIVVASSSEARRRFVVGRILLLVIRTSVTILSRTKDLSEDAGAANGGIVGGRGCVLRGGRRCGRGKKVGRVWRDV